MTSGLFVRQALLDGDAVSLRAEDGVIAGLGAAAQPEPADEVIDGSGLALVPGLVNAHTHAAMTLFRGYADDLPLMEWLSGHIWPAEQRLVADDVYWGTRLACAEMIRTGTTTYWDMYWQAPAAARAAEDAGLRSVSAAPLIDEADPAKSERACAGARRALEEIGSAGGQLSRPGLAPHSIYAVSERSLRWIAETAEEQGVPIQIHLSETEREVADCVAAHGVRPAQYLERCGLLGPGTILAHGVWLDKSELELIARSGATVVTNPVANLKLAVGGIFPYPAARAAGVAMGLGTDGPGSNNSLDLLADVKHFALLQKHAARDPAVASAAEALALARGQLSPLLGGAPLAPGSPADFALVRASGPELSLGGLDAGLVYAASGSIADTTVVAGRVLMRGGVVPGTEEVVARARERAARLGIGRHG